MADFKMLFCFDFDQTIVEGHYHQSCESDFLPPFTNSNGLIINNKVQSDNQEPGYDSLKVIAKTEELLANEKTGLKHPTELKHTFQTLLLQGHNIAITSFSKYPHAIETTLEKLGLTKEKLNRITIVAGYPQTGAQAPNGKIEHIRAAMGHLKLSEAKIVLIDDDEKNIILAKKFGISGIQVPSDSNDNSKNYFQEIRDVASGKTLCNPIKASELVIPTIAPQTLNVTRGFKLGMLPTKRLSSNSDSISKKPTASAVGSELGKTSQPEHHTDTSFVSKVAKKQNGPTSPSKSPGFF